MHNAPQTYVSGWREGGSHSFLTSELVMKPGPEVLDLEPLGCLTQGEGCCDELQPYSIANAVTAKSIIMLKNRAHIKLQHNQALSQAPTALPTLNF